MLYSILIYVPEDKVAALTPAEDEEHVARHLKLHESLVAKNQLGPCIRLMPTATAIQYRSKERAVVDGPFAETKEQLLGLYVVDCESQEEAIAIARSLPSVDSVFEIRPIRLYFPDRIKS